MKPFQAAIHGKNRIAVIAEIKRHSPSNGDFPAHPVAELMKAYEAGGAAAISVVTDPHLFHGSLELLKEVRRATSLPIIRKDFITEEKQIDETAEAGANAILLIARMLDTEALRRLAAYAQAKNLDPLIELHNEEDFQKISGICDIVIGINNRDLKTFKTDVQHASRFLHKIPKEQTIVAESAFQSRDEFAPYLGKIDAVLIGTALLTSENPEQTLASFVH